MKNRRKWFIIGIVTLVVIVASAFGLTRVNIMFGKKTENSEEKHEIVRRGEFVVKVRESGNLRSFIEVDVRSNVEGEIRKIFVEAGELVELGQPLLQIDDKQILEQKKQAEANMEARSAELKQAELRIEIIDKQQTSSLFQAQNSVARAQATLTSFIANKHQRTSEAKTLVATTQNQLNQDNINLRQAEIALEQAKLSLARANATVKSSKISFETAEAEHKRNSDLYEKKLVSKRALEESQNQLANAASQYENTQKEGESQQQTINSQEENINAMKEAIESRKATLQLNKQNVETLEASQRAQEKQLQVDWENAKSQLQQIEETIEEEKEMTRHARVSARANLLQAESQLKSQHERHEWTTVTAPMAGTITRLIVEEGEIITSGRSAFSRGEAIMRIADLTQMIVRTQINQVEISKIQLGQRAEITVDSYPNRIFEGKVSEISPSATQRNQQSQSAVITFEVDIEVIGSPQELLPGMSADVDIIVFEETDILQLPIASVLNPEIFTVKANLTPEALTQFQPGQELTIRNLIGKEFKGRVGQVLTEKQRGNLEILLDEKQQGLRRGPVEIAIVTSGGTQLNGIEAKIDSERQFFVRLDTGKSEEKKGKDDEEKGVKTHIKVGQRNNTHFQITAGLKEGDRVFVPSMMELTQDSGNTDDK